MTNANEEILITYDSRRRNERVLFSESYLEQICTASALMGTQQWHRSVDSYIRNHYVLKLVRTMFDVDSQPLARDELQELLRDARRLEHDTYHMSDTRLKYYESMAAKPKQIQEERNATFDNFQCLATAAVDAATIKIERNDDQPSTQNRTNEPEIYDSHLLDDLEVDDLATLPYVIETTNAKIWHQFATPEIRNNLKNKLANSIFPTADVKNKKMDKLFKYVNSVELEIYESANSLLEYNNSMLNRINKVPMKSEKNSQSSSEARTAQVENARRNSTEYRNLRVLELFTITHPTEDAVGATRDRRRRSSVERAIKIEKDDYSRAKSMTDYFRLVADKKGKLKSNFHIRRRKCKTGSEAFLDV